MLYMPSLHVPELGIISDTISEGFHHLNYLVHEILSLSFNLTAFCEDIYILYSSGSQTFYSPVTLQTFNLQLRSPVSRYETECFGNDYQKDRKSTRLNSS